MGDAHLDRAHVDSRPPASHCGVLYRFFRTPAERWNYQPRRYNMDMPRTQYSLESRWWYAGIGVFLLFALHVSIAPPDASLLFFGLDILFLLIILLCLFMDIRTIRRSEAPWNPNWVFYVVGSFVFPVLFLYVYRRYQNVGLA